MRYTYFPKQESKFTHPEKKLEAAAPQLEGALSGVQGSRKHKEKSPDCDLTSNSHMPQVGTWLSFCRPRSAVTNSPKANDPARLQSKGERSAAYSLRQRPFSPLALTPRVHPPEKCWTIPATRASAPTLSLATHGGNFEATEDVPQPTSCYSLTIFHFPLVWWSS